MPVAEEQMGEVIESYEHAAQPGRVRAMPALLARVDRTWLALAVLLVCVCAVHVGTLLRVPPASTDEGWNAARGLALLQTGQAYGTLDAGVFDRYVGYWTYFPLLGTAIHAAFIGVFGVSLFALRLASVAFGLLLVAEVYVIARTLYNPRAGLLAGFLVASSFPFLFSSHLGRHDIIAAAMGFGAIALCVTGDRGRFPAKSLLAGLLAGLTLDVHPNGLIYGPAVAALYVCDFRWAFFRSRRFWAFVAGGCIAVLYFVAIHILPYPQTYFELYRIGNGSGRTPPLLDLGGQALSSFVDFASDLLSWQLLPFVAALALLLFRRSASDVKLLVLLGTLTVGFAALIRNKEPHYGILIYPAISLVIAVLLLSLFDGARRASPLDFARPLVAWAILAISIAPVLIPVVTYDFDRDLRTVQDNMRGSVAAGSPVIGAPAFWFGLTDHPYYSWAQLAYYRRAVPNSTLEDAFRALHPDYLITDPHIDSWITTDPSLVSQQSFGLYVYKPQYDTFLAKRATLLSKTTTNTFGNVRIYRIDWTKP